MKKVEYGKTYKLLRKKKRVTLEQAAKGIIDPSTLSRWENGKGEMYFDNVVELLKKLHIYYDEFISVARGKEVETDWNIDEISKAYETENLYELEKLVQKWEARYYEDKNEKTLFYLAAVCSCYKELTNKEVMPNDCKTKLNYIFKNVNHWGQYYIQHLGNTVEEIDSELLYSAAIKIIKELRDVSDEDLFRYHQDIFTILSSYFVLIKESPDLAQKLQLEIRTIKFPSQYMELKLTKDFNDELLQYRLGNFSIKEMDKIVSFVYEHGYPNLAKEFISMFKNIMRAKK